MREAGGGRHHQGGASQTEVPGCTAAVLRTTRLGGPAVPMGIFGNGILGRKVKRSPCLPGKRTQIRIRRFSRLQPLTHRGDTLVPRLEAVLSTLPMGGGQGHVAPSQVGRIPALDSTGAWGEKMPRSVLSPEISEISGISGQRAGPALGAYPRLDENAGNRPQSGDPRASDAVPAVGECGNGMF